MMKLFFYVFFTIFTIFSIKVASEEELSESKTLHVITKNIDVNKLEGTFYEISSNTAAKFLPGLACRCTSYDFSQIHTDDKINYINVSFSCQRNFLFKYEKSNLLFKFVLKNPLIENSATVNEFSAHVYLLTEKEQFLVCNNIYILYAEEGDSNKYEYIILGGASPLEPVILLSRQRNISHDDYNRLLNSLYLSGYDANLLNWPFIIPCDQNFCN